MDLGLKGKRVLVEGASSGMGYAIAHLFVEEGAKVAIASSNEERIRKAAKEMGAASYHAVNLSHKGGGGALIRSATEALGGLDILIVNTGGPKAAPFQDLTLADWEEGFAHLYMSAVESIHAALPLMRKQKYGRILLLTSSAAKEPHANLTLSSALRPGLLGLTKILSNESAKDGVTVNAVMPGFIKTERLSELKLDEKKLVEQIPAKRLGDPREVAALFAFLASDQARYITGQAIACDGGYMRSY